MTSRNALTSFLVCALVAYGGAAKAGFLVGNNDGAQGGNDTLVKVLEEINQYNQANNPELVAPTGLFKKTDDDASFVFDPSNGFMFFEDAAGTIPVTGEGALTSLPEAYFKYAGDDVNLLYYSAKGPANFGFSLFTDMPGLNFIDFDGDSREISHVSFWEGQRSIIPPSRFSHSDGCTNRGEGQDCEIRAQFCKVAVLSDPTLPSTLANRECFPPSRHRAAKARASPV